MDMFGTLLALATFALVSSVTPGPNNLMLMTSGINFGFRRTVPHLLGVAGGFTVMIVMVGLGAAQLFAAVPDALTVIKVASVAYLLFMAWKIATMRAPGSGEETAAAKPFSFLQAAMFQWINPKALMMAVTAVSAYAPPGNRLTGLVIVALVFGAINLPCVGAWAVAGARLRALLSDPKRLKIFNITAALLLVASLYPVAFTR